ncbi:MAG TPA: DUF1150 family protein [Alphaproteobacteria bacterium]|nr:DUF1150 family protein [Alphaproteobacteria bacterium]
MHKMDKAKDEENKAARLEQLTRSLTARELGNLGIDDVAYVKSVTIDGQKLHAIHAADGTPLTVVAARDLAFATVLQHEMNPASVH